MLMICVEHILYLLWSAEADGPLQSRRPTSVLTYCLKASKFLSLHFCMPDVLKSENSVDRLLQTIQNFLNYFTKCVN